MSESIAAAPVPRINRTWLRVAAAGFALVVLSMLVVCLVLVDKKHFGWMVGTRFLQIITSGVFVGAILLLLGTWKMPARKHWHTAVLVLWALIALTSPLFGFLFLLPWSVLVLSLPVVAIVFYALFREAATP